MSENTPVSSRRRPLFTFGTSMLAIAHNLCTRSVELKGPLGSMTRRLANTTGSVATPLAYWIQYQWLAILSYVDEQILTVEKNVERLFPMSSHVFDRLDTLVDKVEGLPRKLDDAIMNKLPVVLHKVPFLEWGMMYAVKCLEFVTNSLVIWGFYRDAKEKEIRVDMSSEEQMMKNNEDEMVQIDSYALEGGVVLNTMKCSYKDALEKGVTMQCTEQKSQGEDGKIVDKNGNEDDAKEEEDIYEEDDIFAKEDPLLELFDFGWQTPKMRFTMERSASYT